MTILVWHHLDLRLSDNPALAWACKQNAQILPVYIYDSNEGAPYSIGAASKWWLHHSLEQLQKKYSKKNCPLLIESGDTLSLLLKLIKKYDINTVCWNRDRNPIIRVRDDKIARELKAHDVSVHIASPDLLYDHDIIRNKSGKPYAVFTPFWKNCLREYIPAKPLPEPKSIDSIKIQTNIPIHDLALLPKISWDNQFYNCWSIGEDHALKKTEEYISNSVSTYSNNRNFPSNNEGTSKLSPHLHFGEITPRQIWYMILKNGYPENDPFLRQLVWREFAHHFITHHTSAITDSWHPRFKNFPWTVKKDWLKAWQKGQTGFPIVDAGMRQLWQTGWMHNRVRMIVGSFLVKHLLIPWQEGAKWFWDTLVDADIANNTLGWQWIAGSGPDPAPYFRIFNPYLQSAKFDADGAYIRQWVPELKHLPEKLIHRPSSASKSQLNNYGIKIGDTYPEPIVDHDQARKKAMDAWKSSKY